MGSRYEEGIVSLAEPTQLERVPPVGLVSVDASFRCEQVERRQPKVLDSGRIMLGRPSCLAEEAAVLSSVMENCVREAKLTREGRYGTIAAWLVAARDAARSCNGRPSLPTRERSR